MNRWIRQIHRWMSILFTLTVDRQLRRAGHGRRRDASAVDHLFAAASALPADVHRSLPVRAAVRRQVARRAIRSTPWVIRTWPLPRPTNNQHAADSHDLIRVQGARQNNLKDISVDIPKRRLTVFTGVSGSGKSSLVFGTIAAESQRLINETYSAFLQNFMPSLGRPEVDVLEGLTTAIIVDQERMGANSRSTVGTVTDAQRDAAGALQPSRQAAHRLLQRLLVQHPDAQSERGDDGRQGARAKDRRPRPRLSRRHVPEAARAWARSTTSIWRSSTTRTSRSTRARSRFPASRPTGGWCASSRPPASRSGQADQEVHAEGAPDLPVSGGRPR